MKYIKLLLCLLIVAILSGGSLKVIHAQNPVASDFVLPMDNITRTIGYDIKNISLSKYVSCFKVVQSKLYHAGEDWFASEGTEVKVVANGIVTYIHNKDYPGNVIIVEHVLSDSSKIYSMYAHLKYDNTVTLSQVVTIGDVIGHLVYQDVDFNSKIFDNTHLHWEIRNFRDGSFICDNKQVPAKGYTYPNHPDVFPAIPIAKEYIYPDNPDVLFPIRCERYHNPTEYINNPKTGYCLTYLPIILKEPASPSTNSCYVGRVLVDDGFEGGGSNGPFTGEGTDRVDNKPWATNKPWIKAPSKLIKLRNGKQVIIAGPNKAGIKKGGDTGNDAIKFVGHNDAIHASNEYDHAMYRTVNLPDRTSAFSVTFSLLMETTEFQPNLNKIVNDRIFFDIRKNEGELLNGNYTSGKFECNNVRCNRNGSNESRRNLWIKTDPIQYSLLEALPSIIVGFFANVNEDRQTTFYVDELNIVITKCRY